MRVSLQLVDEQRDLVDHRASTSFPAPPLLAINGAELAGRIGPLVPDRDAVFLEVGDVRLAFEKPEQLMDDGAEVEFFRRQAGKSLAQIKARLPAEKRERAGAGTVAALLAVLEDGGEEVVVGFHGETLNFKL